MKEFTKTGSTVLSAGGRYKRSIVIKQFRTEDGKEHEFTTFLQDGARAGATIAVTREGKVVISHQFRAGPERWMYEIPGGGINPDEDPEVGALRELREETGYLPGHVTFLGTSSRDAYFNCTWYYYLATDCELGKGGRELDDEEGDQGAEVQLISVDELIEHAKKDRMTDPVAVLMAYEKLKELVDNGKRH